jgi:hypothetical protein
VLLASGLATAYAAGPVQATQLSRSSTGATIAVSPARPGARAAVKLNVRHTFYCGRPRAATIAFKFPAAEHVPSSIKAGDVHLSAGRVKAVHVSGRTVSVSVQPAPTKGITCMVIVLGKLQVMFDKAARFGNPSKTGSYAIAVADGASRYTGRFKISS